MTIYYLNQPCWNDLGYDEGYNEHSVITNWLKRTLSYNELDYKEHSVITNSITKNTQLKQTSFLLANENLLHKSTLL